MLSRSVACLACAHGMTAWAAPADTMTEAAFFSAQPVVLSASRLSQPVNRAPAAVTVITREMIEASGFRHLVDVLRLVPGFVVGWSGGNTPAATHLGLSDAFPHWMQVMVDGRSVYHPVFGQTTWRGLPVTLDEVDRIEVVRGPNAANDGINALLGTIHIYTRHAGEAQGGMAEVALGSQRYREINLRYDAQTATGGWRLGLLGREDQRHGVALDHASDVQLSFRGDFQPTLRDSLMLQFGASRGFWQGGNVGYVLSPDQRSYFLSGYVNGRWTRALGEGREWSLQAHHTFSQNEEPVRPPPAWFFLDPLNANSRVHASGIQVTYLDKSAADVRASVSGGYYRNTLYGPYFLDSEGTLEDRIAQLSGAIEWNLSPRWVLHAGAMIERHTDPAGTHFSPRLAVNWLPAPAHAFRAGASHAVSALGLYANHTDIHLTVGGVNVDQVVSSMGALEPERIDSQELGYLFDKPEWSLKLDVRAFHNRLRDIVDPVYVASADPDGLHAYANGGTVRQDGLEYQLRWQPLPRGWLVLSQSWVRTDDDLDGRYERATPRNTLSLLAAHPVAGIDASIGYYRVGTLHWMVWPEAFNGFQHTSPHASLYNRLDLRLAKAWKTAEGRLEAALVVQALLGEENEAFHYYGPQTFGRRAYLSLKHAFR